MVRIRDIASKLFAVSLVLLLIGLATFFTLDTFVSLLQRSALLIEKQKAELAHLVSASQRLDQQISEFETGNIDQTFWGDIEDTATFVNVQNTIDGLADDLDIRSLTQVQNISDTDLSRLIFRVEGQASYDDFVQFLYDLHSSQPPLITEAATVRAVPSVGNSNAYSDVFFQVNVAALTRAEAK